MKDEIVKAVSDMQKYIEIHLSETITLSDLAKACNYSVYYAARIFKDTVGMPPFEYIRKRRLTQAAWVLRDHKTYIIDVAFDFVFDSHEGFTRAFAKNFGMAPKAYAKKPEPIPMFLPHNVLMYHQFLKKKEKNVSSQTLKAVFVQIVERPERKAIIKRGLRAKEYFSYCEEVECDVWGVLMSVKEAIHEPIGMWLPPTLQTPNSSEYVQGVEVPIDYQGNVPEGFELITLKPCKMMVFQGEPYDDLDFQEEVGLVMKFIQKYDPSIYGYQWADDDGPRYQLEPQGYRGYIEARPVRERSSF